MELNKISKNIEEAKENKIVRFDQNAAAIYLPSLNSERGQRTMLQALNVLSDNADAASFA